ncbi:MAG: tetratricopeptide repeat protein, partial [Acidobacteriota bacterium]
MKNYIVTAFLLLMMSISAFAQEFTKEDLRETSIQTVKLFQQKKYDEALPLAEKSVLIAKQIYGEKNIETVNVLKNLGYVQLYKGDTDEAGKTFDKAFDIYQDLENLSANDKTSAADIAETVASIKSQKDLKSTEKYYKQAMIWREEGEGVDSPKSLTPLIGLANINYWKKNYKQSAEFYERAIKIGAENSDAENTNFLAVYLRGECAFKKAGKSDEFEKIKENFSVSFPTPTGSNATKDPQVAFAITSGVVNGKALNLVAPAYPAEAKYARATGAVKVKVLINEQGNVISACGVNDAHSSLIEASETAAYNSKFQPTSLKGKPVKVTGIIIYNFT